MVETLFPVKDAARRLGISVWTLRKKAYEGDVASVKVGSLLQIPESEIARLIQEGMRPRRETEAIPQMTSPWTTACRGLRKRYLSCIATMVAEAIASENPSVVETAIAVLAMQRRTVAELFGEEMRREQGAPK